jgi:hypothetical protein
VLGGLLRRIEKIDSCWILDAALIVDLERWRGKLETLMTERSLIARSDKCLSEGHEGYWDRESHPLHVPDQTLLAHCFYGFWSNSFIPCRVQCCHLIRNVFAVQISIPSIHVTVFRQFENMLPDFKHRKSCRWPLEIAKVFE